MVTTKIIKLDQSYKSYGQSYKLAQDNHRINIQYNSHHNSNFDDKGKFVDINLLCNKFNIQLLINNSATYTKKYHVNKTDKKAGKTPQSKITGKKKFLIKYVRKKSLKASIPISNLVNKLFPDIQAVFIKTNLVKLALHL